MRALALSELLRTRARTLLYVLMLIGVVVAVIIGIVTFANSDKRGTRPQPRSERCERVMREIQTQQGPPSAGQREELREACQFQRRKIPFLLAERLATTTRGYAGGLLPLVGIVLGASLLGAEWRSGGVERQLTWEPRRGRVLAAKLAVTSGVLVAVGVALCVVLLICLLPATFAKGSAEGAGGGFWLSMLGVWLRAGLLTAFTGAIGMSIAFISRNTSAPIVFYFAYGIVETILGQWKEGFRDASLNRNAAIFIGEPIGLGIARVDAGDVLQAGMILAGYLAVLVAAGYVSFITRDV